MKILQVNTYDVGGGAEKIAQTLHSAYRAGDHQAWMVVKRRRGNAENVVALDSGLIANPYVRFWFRAGSSLRSKEGKLRGAHRLGALLEDIGSLGSMIRRQRGIETGHPASRYLLSHVPIDPDIIHLHNLHGDYFDLSILPELSRNSPVALTLHDAWTFTGHCACTLECQRWKSGCGECPHLDTPPAVVRDNTHRNWLTKLGIYQQSRLYVAAPSQWMTDMVSQSILSNAAADVRLIRNGVDLSVFRPAEKALPRTNIGVQKEALVLLFVAASAKSNPFKDYDMLRTALSMLGSRQLSKPVVAIALGDTAPTEQIGSIELRHVPFSSDPSMVAQYYQAADVCLHPAKTDNFPTVVIEALACGVPVVATSVGGIPEQIEDGLTGYLVPPGDSEAMAARVGRILEDEQLQRAMSTAAVEAAVSRFDERTMASAYLDWYAQILEDWRGRE